MPNLGAVNTLVVTYATPVNNSANVTLANVNVNVAAIGSDYDATVETIMVRGVWSGNKFIPVSQITLITALGN